MNTNLKKAIEVDFDKLAELKIEVHSIHVDQRPDVFRNIEDSSLKDVFSNMLKDDEFDIFILEDGVHNILAYAIYENSIIREQSIFTGSKNMNYG